MSEAAEETLIDTTAPAEATETIETAEAPAEATNDAAWYFADEVPGTGDKPDWLKDKYKSVADQAKAYGDLEKKLGSFTGAPEEGYELTLPEGIEGQFDTEDPRLAWFQDAAKNSNMSQEAFTNMLHGFVQQEVDSQHVNREAEISQLGQNAQARLKNLGDWGQANLSPEQFEGMKALATTALGVQTLEAIIAQTREARIPTQEATVKSGRSEDELRQMVASPEYQSNPAFRKKVEQEFAEFYGQQPYQNVMK